MGGKPVSDIFNDYNENGYRLTINNTRSSRTEDNAILYNVRFAFGDKVAHMSDQALVNAYDEFSMGDIFGDNDERFLEFLKDWEPR